MMRLAGLAVLLNITMKILLGYEEEIEIVTEVVVFATAFHVLILVPAVP